MKRSVFASFESPELAERALGALLDHGVRSEDVSVIVSAKEPDDHRPAAERTIEVREHAEKGITTTTPEDAVAAMPAGAAVGLGLGAAVGVASLLIPGVGLVIGGGALALAITGAVGATAAGAVTMGALGYLKDQGVDEVAAQNYDRVIGSGGALLAADIPSGDVDEETVRGIMIKYGASGLESFDRNDGEPRAQVIG